MKDENHSLLLSTKCYRILVLPHAFVLHIQEISRVMSDTIEANCQVKKR